jgi:hypothetical protein
MIVGRKLAKPCCAVKSFEIGAAAIGGYKTDARYSFAISPQVSREFCYQRSALQTEGAGNAGRSMRPQPRVYW